MMKRTASTLMILIGSVCLISSQAQEHISLNGNWAFTTDLYQQGEREQWFHPETNIAGWDQMTVPGVWGTRNEYADFAGTAWYRTDFVAESEWEELWVRLVFQAVYNDVKVWLNGHYLGDHHIGFLPFEFDISSHLKWGENNVLVLSVDNTFKRGAIWNWGGIRRPVWLEVTEKVRLEKQHITAVPDLDKGDAAIDIRFTVSNFDQQAANIQYQLKISKDKEQLWSSAELPLLIEPGESKEGQISLTLPPDQVALWHYNFPHLYEADLVLIQDGKEMYRMKDRFGIRKIEVDGLELKLNGEAFRPVGFNIVAEDRVSGSVLPLSRIKEDVDLLKQLGVNMARLNHLPLPKEYLDYLDEKGIMIFEEVSLWGKDVMVDPDHPLPKYWLETMIRTKYNHPSVIGWSIGNEIGYATANPKAMAYVEGAIKQAKELDPTRLAIYVSHSAQSQKVDPVQFSDLIMLNKYGNWGTAVDQTHALHPGKPIFYSEYGQQLNHEDPNQSFIDAKTILDSFRGKPHVIGASLWTFNDYRSFWQASPTWSTPPSQNRSWGIVNVFRQKKKAYHAFRKEYAPISSLKVKLNAEGRKGILTLTPRSKLDIPASPLRGYRLIWSIWDEENKLVDGGFNLVPELMPGDPAFEQNISYKETGTRLAVELLDPQSYSVWDSSIYWQVPQSPSIKAIHTSSNTARLIFDKLPDATSYFVRYGQGSLSSSSASSINDFIDIEGLEYDQEYQFALVAVNGKGESVPSAIQKARTDEDELPPIIWETVAADQAFFIGYTVGRRDYLYEIQYGTQTGQYSHQISLRNVGVCQVPNLENGTTYYYRLRRRMQWGFASEWSDERSITPGNPSSEEKSMTVGLIRQGTEAMLLFDPVKRSTGYTLRIRDVSNGFSKTISIATAQSGRFWLTGLEKDRDYVCELRPTFLQF